MKHLLNWRAKMKSEENVIVEAEKLVAEISRELRKLKNASSLLDDANRQSERLIEISENIIEDSKKLFSVGNEILNKLRDADVPAKIDSMTTAVNAVNKNQIASSKDLKEVINKSHIDIITEVKTIPKDIQNATNSMKEAINNGYREVSSKNQETSNSILNTMDKNHQKIIKFEVISIGTLILILIMSGVIYLKIQ